MLCRMDQWVSNKFLEPPVMQPKLAYPFPLQPAGRMPSMPLDQHWWWSLGIWCASGICENPEVGWNFSNIVKESLGWMDRWYMMILYIMCVGLILLLQIVEFSVYNLWMIHFGYTPARVVGCSELRSASYHRWRDPQWQIHQRYWCTSK